MFRTLSLNLSSLLSSRSAAVVVVVDVVDSGNDSSVLYPDIIDATTSGTLPTDIIDAGTL
jgi:hypothetical protein